MTFLARRVLFENVDVRLETIQVSSNRVKHLITFTCCGRPSTFFFDDAHGEMVPLCNEGLLKGLAQFCVGLAERNIDLVPFQHLGEDLHTRMLRSYLTTHDADIFGLLSGRDTTIQFSVPTELREELAPLAKQCGGRFVHSNGSLELEFRGK